jgi:cytidylate kinase
MIIAIDGPSGAGKSTLGKRLAKELGLLYLDTGAMYRAVALRVLEEGVDPKDAEGAARVAASCEVELSGEPGNLHVFVDGRDVSGLIRTGEVGQAASTISTISEVRRLLVRRQQELGRRGAGCVLDGRDIGTVVFPEANVKIFLTAAPESRARRRFDEDASRGVGSTFDTTLKEINERDERDTSREDSPLKVAEGATVIDTSDLGLDEAFEQMMQAVRDSAPKR